MADKINETGKEGGKGKHGFSCIDFVLVKCPKIHIKGYNYCGINTNLEELLADNVTGINKLDCACMEHDIAYSESIDPKWRYISDKILLLKAFQRMYAIDSRIGERLVALIISSLIGVKMLLVKIEICIDKFRNRTKKTE